MRPLRLRIVRILAEDAVPLVDDDDERALRLRVDGIHHPPQVITTQIIIVRIFLQQIPEKRIFQ